MCPLTNRDEFDLHHMIVRSLYFGLGVNVVVPVVGLFVCYWVGNNYVLDNQLGDQTDILFYVLGAVSIAQAGIALWWRSKILGKPMIRTQETFADDLSDGILAGSRPVFAIIAAISVWGYLFFYLTGFFREGAFFVVFSFLVFQVVRPRLGFVSKLIDRQKELVKQGKFLTS